MEKIQRKLKHIIIILVLILVVGVSAQAIVVWASSTLHSSEKVSAFNCNTDIETEKIDEDFVECLQEDKKQMMDILDDKLIDKKEADLLQRVSKKVSKEYFKGTAVNILNRNDRDFMKHLETFENKGYTEVTNAKYKAAVNLFFDEWIQNAKESVK